MNKVIFNLFVAAAIVNSVNANAGACDYQKMGLDGRMKWMASHNLTFVRAGELCRAEKQKKPTISGVFGYDNNGQVFNDAATTSARAAVTTPDGNGAVVYVGGDIEKGRYKNYGGKVGGDVGYGKIYFSGDIDQYDSDMKWWGGEGTIERFELGYVVPINDNWTITAAPVRQLHDMNAAPDQAVTYFKWVADFSSVQRAKFVGTNKTISAINRVQTEIDQGLSSGDNYQHFTLAKISAKTVMTGTSGSGVELSARYQQSSNSAPLANQVGLQSRAYEQSVALGADAGSASLIAFVPIDLMQNQIYAGVDYGFVLNGAAGQRVDGASGFVGMRQNLSPALAVDLGYAWGIGSAPEGVTDPQRFNAALKVAF